MVNSILKIDRISKRAVRNRDGSITIEEGDGYKIMAYKFEHHTNNQNLITDKRKNEEFKGKFKNTLIGDIFGNPFTFVVVLWEHPNYGYFADAGFFWRSMHRDWELVHVVAWMERYVVNMEEINKSPLMEGLKKIAGKGYDKALPTGINLFLQDYPEFRELFEEGE